MTNLKSEAHSPRAETEAKSQTPPPTEGAGDVVMRAVQVIVDTRKLYHYPGLNYFEARQAQTDAAIEIVRALSAASLLATPSSGDLDIGPRVRRTAPGLPTWLPIESAPKDGTQILIGHDGERWIRAVVWDKEFESVGFNEKTLKTKYRGAWTDGAVHSFAYETCASYEPTHWMPLPLPPTNDKSEDTERRGNVSGVEQ